MDTRSRTARINAAYKLAIARGRPVPRSILRKVI